MYIEVDAFVEKWPLVGSSERKLGHVTLATNRILHSLYGFHGCSGNCANN